MRQSQLLSLFDSFPLISLNSLASCLRQMQMRCAFDDGTWLQP